MGDLTAADGGTPAEVVPVVEQEIVAVETDPTGRYTRVRINFDCVFQHFINFVISLCNLQLIFDVPTLG